MAAAEARAAWQRTANRYFVQEDAKRAPKLACVPPSSSSSSSLSKQTNPRPPTTGITDFAPPEINSMYSSRDQLDVLESLSGFKMVAILLLLLKYNRNYFFFNGKFGLLTDHWSIIVPPAEPPDHVHLH
ncbi:hypothetical protein HanPI659440_Chr00c07g0717681 [Helianthus annuus]|nr:hypothetical protein HanPI659440_Chr00c07g0717681 [Helianthus annuus]